MKSSDKPEISKKWWLSEKPSTIKGAELEKALAAAEKALSDAEKKEDADSIKAALAALDSLSSAVDKTIKKECDKKKDKDLITVLGKYDDVIGDEVKELEKAQSALGKAAEKLEEGEDEESDNKLFTPDYLIKMIRLLKTGAELKFCFGLNKSTPEDSRLVLDRKRDPERLMKMLKATGDFTNRLMTYGYATGDGKILQFRLAENAKEPSQIVKLAKVYLKKNRELKFKKIKVLLPSGEGFEEDMPDDEQDTQAAGGAGAGDLQQRIRGAESADLTWKKARASLADQIAQLRQELNAFDDPDVESVHDGLLALLEKTTDPDFAALAQSTDPATFESTLAKTRVSIAEWRRSIGQGGAFQTIDENPFVQTDIVGTIGNALASIASDLHLA